MVHHYIHCISDIFFRILYLILDFLIYAQYKKYLKKTISEYISTSPEPYPYWTIKEIYEQPNTILSAINSGGRIKNEYSVDESYDMLISEVNLSIKKIIFSISKDDSKAK